MARARNIKPGFFKNEVLAEMPFETRLLFIGLWTLADREGRMEDRPKRIRAEIFALDMIDIDPMLDRLRDDKFIVRYEVDGVRYIQVANFTKHQMPHHKEVASVIPAPPGCDQITRHPYDVPAKVRAAVFQRDGHQCLKCGAKDHLSIDHVNPLACGGDNSITNLQTLCKSCNSSKGDTAKDYRKTNVEPTSSQRKANDGGHCPSDSLTPDSLTPDLLIPEEEPAAADAPATAQEAGKTSAPDQPKASGKFDPLTAKPDNVSAESWAAWCAHRKQLRKTLTEETCKRQVKALAAHHDPDAVIDLSIQQGWTGLFPEKITSNVLRLPAQSRFTNLPKVNADEIRARTAENERLGVRRANF